MAMGIAVAIYLLGFCILGLWPIVHCATSRTLGGGAKALFIIGMLFLGIIFVPVYILFFSHSGKLKVLFFFYLLTIPIGLYVGSRMGAQELSKEFEQFQHFHNHVDDYQSEGVSFEKAYQFSTDLRALETETRNLGWTEIEDMGKISTLVSKAEGIIGDRQITKEEYQDWRSHFDNRSLLKSKAVANSVTGI